MCKVVCSLIFEGVATTEKGCCLFELFLKERDRENDESAGKIGYDTVTEGTERE